MQIISLTTDFGSKDWFVGAMKGVIAGFAPRARVVDLTHEIPPGDVGAGAFALAAGCRHFPKGAVHLAVVDPGVGSRRRAVAVQTDRFIFVGPDNGVLSLALRGERIRRVHALENKACFLPQISRTFHGRDIFAPVAAHLCRGLAIRTLGRPLKGIQLLAFPQARQGRGGIDGTVVYLDRFGNAFTNIPEEMVPPAKASSLQVVRKGRVLCAVAAFYQAVLPGQALGIFGSAGWLEIAVNQGSAAQALTLRVGDPISLRFDSPGLSAAAV